jgi:hypothetical protein
MDYKQLIINFQDELHSAIQADLEHGSSWMNEEASKKFVRDYPALNEFISKFLGLGLHTDSDDASPADMVQDMQDGPHPAVHGGKRIKSMNVTKIPQGK